MKLWIPYRYDHGLMPAPELQWSRWALKHKIETIRFVSCFPDLPLVVTPEHALSYWEISVMIEDREWRIANCLSSIFNFLFDFAHP